MNDLSIIEQLQAEATALKQQRGVEEKKYNAKIHVLSGEIEALKKEKKNLKEYLDGKLVAEKKKLQELQDKELAQLNKANELVNESSAKKNEADEIIDDAAKLLLKATTDINIKLSNVRLKEEAVLARSEKVAEKEDGVKQLEKVTEERKAEQDANAIRLHKEAHEGTKRLKAIMVKEKKVAEDLEAIEMKLKDAQKVLRDNNIVLDRVARINKEIGETKYIISGKEDLIANREEAVVKREAVVEERSKIVKQSKALYEAKYKKLQEQAKKLQGGK